MDQYKQTMMMDIYKTGFALNEVVLFLDTHPTNQKALSYYYQVQKAYADAKNAYQAAYGPLANDQVTGGTWNWIEDPWPWEGGYQ